MLPLADASFDRAAAPVLDLVEGGWAASGPALPSTVGPLVVRLGLAAELRRRLEVADRHGDAVGLLRLVIVFESGDATPRKLARHWETVRQPATRGYPRPSPC